MCKSSHVRNLALPVLALCSHIWFWSASAGSCRLPALALAATGRAFDMKGAILLEYRSRDSAELAQQTSQQLLKQPVAGAVEKETNKANKRSQKQMVPMSICKPC